MERGDRLALSLCTAIVIACAVYALGPPAPVYYPVEHAWNGTSGSTPGMAWYGNSACALGAGALGLGLAWAGLARLPQRLAQASWLPRAAGLVTLATLIVTLGDLVLHEIGAWMR
jgi:hypothetical protein